MAITDTFANLGTAIINFVNRKIVTSISASSTDTTVPSAKCVYDAIQAGGGGNYQEKEYVEAEWTEAVRDINLARACDDRNSWKSLAYDGSKFVALSSQGNISTSTDGITWTQATRIQNLDAGGWECLVYDGSKFVALNVSGCISTSTDGTTWTLATQIENLGENFWTALTYNGSKFVAISLYGHVSISTDGTTWTQATQNENLGQRAWRGLVYDGNKFVALNPQGYVSTSTDGTTWTQATKIQNLGFNNWWALAYGGSKFVALGYEGYVSTNPGLNQTILKNTEGDVLSVEFTNGNTYQLLDSNGNIPNERIPALGNIETLLSQI